MNWRFWKKICANNSMEDDKQVSLTPALLNRDSESDKKQYRSVLNLARKLEEKDILNIALTGPYGSGKSSILRSLMKDYRKYKYLSISLATLKSPLDDKKNKIDIDTMNNRIEYSILQQLIYKEKQETLYNSRLKRIYHKSTWAQYALSFAIIFYIVALIIVFEPSFLEVDWICNRLSNPVLNKWSDIFALSYIFVATIIFVQKTVKSLSNSKLNKLNLKNGEIELKENKEDTSVFNKHMDEIVYFFEVTDYNVVIIEDLDRFDNTDIFLKLREVNQLLNQSNSVGRKVTFIYAVKDDMFFDEERTKFFDYITTVIPIINSSNSADKLKEELEIKGYSDLNVEVIDSLAFFIDDMRLLKNIVNEYAQYREKLDEKLDQNKLLAMIVYKNYHPKDFADLHKGKGVLYDCLHKKSELLVERNRQIDERINGITKKLQSLEATHAIQEKELRLIYIEGYRRKLSKQNENNAFLFFVENNFIPLEDIAENETLFNSFISQSSFRYQCFKRHQTNTYYGVRYYYDTSEDSCNIQFSQIEKIVNSTFTYHERLEALREGEKRYREQIKILELSRNNHYATPIQELLLDVDMQTHKIFSELNVSKMLEVFLKEGLINEDYFDYISSLSDVNNIQWEFAIEVDIVIPAWPEIYAFYESQNNVMISSLRIFITKHIDELTDISELDDTQKELLAHSALLTSDFEILVYDKLVKIFDGVTFKDADINSVDNAHFKSLLCADMLPYSTYYTTTIRDNHSDVLTYYVDKYLDECIIEIEELPTDMRLYKHLMKNPRVIGEKALSVVQHFLPHIVWDNELANITLPVLKNNIEKFDYDIEKNILVASTNLPERLSFLIDLVEKFRDDFDIVTELIESLGDSYRSITDKSKKATIENNHMNEMLLGKLKTIGYISSYREDDDKLRVSHKRNH